MAAEEASADARALTRVLARSVAQPAIPRGLVDGDAGAIDKLDRQVLDRLLVGDVRRVKIWRGDGTILYSDESKLIGAKYPLDDEETQVLENGGTEAEVSDLTKPENRFETESNGLVEVYTRIHSPEGEPMLFEVYYSADDLAARRRAVFAPIQRITVGGLLAMLVIATPIIWVLTRRLTRNARERERLLRASMTASEAERRRIARDLHDGVVQDLAGTAFSLTAVGRDARVPDDAAGRPRERRPVAAHQPEVAAVAAGLDPSARPARRRSGRRADRPARRRLRPLPSRRTCASPTSGPFPTTPSRWSGGWPRRPCATRSATPVRPRLEVDVTARGRPAGAARSPTTGKGSTPRATETPRASGCAGCASLVAGRGWAARRTVDTRRGDRGTTGGGAQVSDEMITVVVVDDHAVVRGGLSQLLAGVADLRVVGTASDGAEAVEVVRATRPDVVLMDLQMPGVDGVSATRSIVAEELADVLVLTSYADAERIVGALDAGAVGYLLKDAEPDDILGGIRAVARGESPIAPAGGAGAARHPAAVGATCPDLTPREREVLQLVREGLANKQIARRLGITERTVKAHLTSIFATIGVADRTSAALWAERHRV